MWLGRVKPPYPMKAMAYGQRSSNHSAVALVTSRAGMEIGLQGKDTEPVLEHEAAASGPFSVLECRCLW